ncbi:aminotransferase class I/II-fold pyridoxal phosphate-dependent enzyme [Sinorhizobium psoraleae]|uniref:cysteine-S-conjugate beta-lyase n=1 Tax=Sinorhizobium psoraleae TaxID=520838 RepID=A0ABT4K9H9_9HYPH|nr:aminotransferase class I/II-fold pyridoxal phosphate-dependent enzyme [Sinorhizobium psoraleae]MCZ4088615.1 aminotransferase class I/II-fold pyridoxal phosphate-dependent enzyme [Sinorhizobium psoraleae]
MLIQPPVYAHFHNDVLLNGRHLAYAPLEFTGDGYRFNEKTFEAAIRPNTKIFILSHPHNPTGNVWSEDELRTMGEICARNGILVISDEIHEDLILNPQKKHIPFASLGEEFAQNSITCTAPSKTFNLPGLQSANVSFRTSGFGKSCAANTSATSSNWSTCWGWSRPKRHTRMASRGSRRCSTISGPITRILPKRSTKPIRA